MTGAPPHSLARTSLGDLTEAGNVEDAADELRRAMLDNTDAAYARWARRWAEASVEALRELIGERLDDDDRAELAALIGEEA